MDKEYQQYCEKTQGQFSEFLTRTIHLEKRVEDMERELSSFKVETGAKIDKALEGIEFIKDTGRSWARRLEKVGFILLAMYFLNDSPELLQALIGVLK